MATPAAPTTWFGRFIGGIEGFFTHDAFPFLKTLFYGTLMDEIHALAPLAEGAVAALEAELPLLLTQGSEGFLKAFNATVAGTTQAAEAAGLNVATHSVITASQAALANAEAKLKAVAAGP
jgi:hypothetical protein